MWKEKTLFARGRLPENFGSVVQAFIDRGEGQEHLQADKYVWHGWTAVKETSSRSEWLITFQGRATKLTPFNAAFFGTKAQHVTEYRMVITAALQVDHSIRLAAEGTEEDWDKLDGLWNKLWTMLQDQGYKEAPAVEASATAPRQKLAERDADDMDVQARKKLLRGYLERVLIKAQSQRLAAELAGGNRSSLERWRKEFPEVEEEVRAAVKKRK